MTCKPFQTCLGEASCPGLGQRVRDDMKSVDRFSGYPVLSGDSLPCIKPRAQDLVIPVKRSIRRRKVNDSSKHQTSLYTFSIFAYSYPYEHEDRRPTGQCRGG